MNMEEMKIGQEFVYGKITTRFRGSDPSNWMALCHW